MRIEQQPTLQAITRKDRERAITIFANVAPGASQADAIARPRAIARQRPARRLSGDPLGQQPGLPGVVRVPRSSPSSWACIVAYMVLAAQFNAFTHPLTVLLALPFSVSGALLDACGQRADLNVYSMLGMILLMGIAKKNSIMLVDFTNQIRERGVERHAGDPARPARIRLRPILMTSTGHHRGRLARRPWPSGPGPSRSGPWPSPWWAGWSSPRCSRCSSCPPPTASSTTSSPGTTAAAVGARAWSPSWRAPDLVSTTAVETRGVPAARDVFGLVGFVLLCFGVSILGGMAAVPAVPDWYAHLAKPTWTPPGWVFGPVWTVLYPMMAVAGWLVWRKGRSRRATLLFLLQLALNAAWPWLFFFLRRPDWAFAAVTVLAVAILAAIVAFLPVSRGAALLLVPYLGWVLFAGALNLAIWRLNPD